MKTCLRQPHGMHAILCQYVIWKFESCCLVNVHNKKVYISPSYVVKKTIDVLSLDISLHVDMLCFLNKILTYINMCRMVSWICNLCCLMLRINPSVEQSWSF